MGRNSLRAVRSCQRAPVRASAESSSAKLRSSASRTAAASVIVGAPALGPALGPGLAFAAAASAAGGDPARLLRRRLGRPGDSRGSREEDEDAEPPWRRG